MSVVNQSEIKRKFVPVEVAKKIGTTAAMLLQHIQFWMQSQSVEILYRTNAQLASDFNLMFSESQIQYAKKKLIDLGYIVVTKPNKYDRTTHYQLTDLSKKMLGIIDVVKDKVSEVKEVVKESVKTGTHKVVETILNIVDKPSTSVKQQNKAIVRTQDSVKPSGGLASTKAMQESFNEGFTNKKAVPMPKDLLAQMREKIRGSRDVSNNSLRDYSLPEHQYDGDKCLNFNDDVMSDTNIPEQDLNRNDDSISSTTQYDGFSLSGMLGSVFSAPPNLDASKQRMYNEELKRSYREW